MEVKSTISTDTVASELAVALGAIKLILLTDVKELCWILQMILLSHISASDIADLIERKVINGGMLPKIECCLNALNGGVERTHIIDGRIEHSILIELLSDEGIGTMITI